MLMKMLKIMMESRILEQLVAIRWLVIMLVQKLVQKVRAIQQTLQKVTERMIRPVPRFLSKL
jgi:hypothetical protein